MYKSNQLLWYCRDCNKPSFPVTQDDIRCLNCGNKYTRENKIWECAGSFTPSGFTRNRSEHLQDIEQDHFWFDARDRLLRIKLLALKRQDDHHLLDLGCGSGRVLATLAGEFNRIVGVEGHLAPLNKAVRLNPYGIFLHANVTDTPLKANQFDWVTAFDVLEHVDPTEFFREAFRLTQPGGMLLISVPAFPLLWSHVDELAGHRCRYRLKTLSKELSAAGWQLRGHTYFQFFLFPLLVVSRMISRTKQSKLERKPPKSINKILQMINNLEVHLFKAVRLPYGSSLIAWAEKPLNNEVSHER